jgi:SHS2 domain-containing protein
LGVGQITTDFCPTLTTNPTQHDSHGPDDHPKTIDYHHMDISRDDGMDEHGID